MASDPPLSEPEPPDDGRGPTRLAPVRAFVVLAVFVVGVVTLVNVGTRSSVDGDALAPVATTTTVAHQAKKSTTTTTTVPRSEITVVVANATAENGLAGHYTTLLQAQG